MGGGVLKAAAGICEEVLRRLPICQWVPGDRDHGPGLSGLPVSVKSPSWAPGPGRTDKNRRFRGPTWYRVVSGPVHVTANKTSKLA